MLALPTVARKRRRELRIHTLQRTIQKERHYLLAAGTTYVFQKKAARQYHRNMELTNEYYEGHLHASGRKRIPQNHTQARDEKP